MVSSEASVAELWASLPHAEREALARRWDRPTLVAALTGLGRLRLSQNPPANDWSIWTILAGRGFGKTRTGAEWILEKARAAGSRFALVGASLESARAVMVEGESGLLALAPAEAGLRYHPSLHKLSWENGSTARLYSGGEPDGLRGGQFHHGWGDEFAHWPRADETLTNLRLSTRLGVRPQLLLTTTPLPLDWLRRLLVEPGVVVTRGRMRDNRANLPADFLTALERRFGGSMVGRQELDGELVESLEGALWTRALLEAQRRSGAPAMTRVVVGVDPPAGGANGVCGIVVAGLDAGGAAWVLEDASVVGGRPEGWARAVVAAADRWQADRVIAEVNNGGDMVVAVLKAVDAALPVQPVRAARGKVARAEPVAGLYGEKRVFHTGSFPALEDQLCGLMANGVFAGPGTSPDRADALVWALSALLLGRAAARPGVRGI
jgi:phage terminase large subunit-like protein